MGLIHKIFNELKNLPPEIAIHGFVILPHRNSFLTASAGYQRMFFISLNNTATRPTMIITSIPFAGHTDRVKEEEQ